MMERQEIARSMGRKLSAAHLPSYRAVLGFDGFVDEISEVVGQRITAEKYERLATIAEFGKRVSQAAGKSANIELVVRKRKLGGNGPIMAHALATLGVKVDYLGTVGAAHAAAGGGNDLDPVFREFAQRAGVVALAPAARTTALEFKDGKVMLGDLAPLSQVTWARLVEKIGLEELRGLFGQAMLLGMVNWTMLPWLTSIWESVAEQVLPLLPAGPRRVFIDLADPGKRSAADLGGAMEVLTRINGLTPVTLGLNYSEAVQVAGALGLSGAGDMRSEEHAMTGLAVQIREKLALSAVVVHPRGGAAAATAEGTARFSGPFVREPAISTGAGDHFNAGFATGELLGCTLEECLCLGTALSGYYVLNAESPTAVQLASFLEDLPVPQAIA